MADNEADHVTGSTYYIGAGFKGNLFTTYSPERAALLRQAQRSFNRWLRAEE